MAYVTVMDDCLDGNHLECKLEENVPTDPNMIGGGHCICVCHGNTNLKWYEEVKASALKAREARNERES